VQPETQDLRSAKPDEFPAVKDFPIRCAHAKSLYPVLDVGSDGIFRNIRDRVREPFCEWTVFDQRIADFSYFSVPDDNPAPADRFYNMFICSVLMPMRHGISP
jgi:hypothetical protein